MSETIILGLNIFFGALIFFGMFWGLIRGLKKTTSRLIFLLLMSVALIFLCVPLVTAILKIKISATIIVDGVSTQSKLTILEFIRYFIEEQLGVDFIANFPEITNILVAVAIALVNALLYVILFWLLKLLLLPINALLTKLIFRKRKKKEEKVNLKNMTKKERKAYKKEHKAKKYRLLGALVGALVGLVTTFNTMIPIYGVMDIVSRNNKTTFNNLSEEPISLDKLTDGLTTDIVKAYELSIVGRLSKGLGLQYLGLKSFDTLTTAPIGEKEFTLRDDINSLVDTAVEADKLLGIYKSATTNGLENITTEDLSLMLSTTKTLITKCESAELVNVLSGYIIPIAYELMLESDIKLSEDDFINEQIINTIGILAEETNIKVFEELKGLVNVAEYLNNQNILIKLISGKTDGMLTTVKSLDEDFAVVLTNKLFDLQIVNKTFPNIINIAFTLFDNATNFGYTQNNATTEELQTSFAKVLSSIISTANTCSEESSMFLTEDSLIELGKTLDTLKASKLYNTSTYNNLIKYAINQVKGNLISSLPESIHEVVNTDVIDNVYNIALIDANSTNVSSWKNEMSTIHDAINILLNRNSEGEELTFDNLFIEENLELSLKNLGKALDKLEQTHILGAPTTYSYNGNTKTTSTLLRIVSCFFDELKESSDSEDDNTNEIINIAQSNLVATNHVYVENGTFWETEFNSLAPTIKYLSDLTAEEEVELTTELGQHLDNLAHNTIIFGGDTTLKIVDMFISDFGSDETVNNLISDISTNLNDEDTKTALANDEHFWETEMECIMALNNISDKVDSISDVDGAIEIAPDLDQLYSSRIIPYMSLNEMISDVIASIKTDGATEGSVDYEINALIDDICTDITTQSTFDAIKTDNFWQTELANMKELHDINFDNTDGDLVNSLDTLGAKLEDITDNSSLITNVRIRKIIASAINSEKESISESFTGSTGEVVTEILGEISLTLYNKTLPESEQAEINSLENELGHLKTLATIDVSDTIDNPLKNKLADIGETFDTITTGTEASKVITDLQIRKILSASITDMKDSFGTSDFDTSIKTALTDISTNIYNVNKSADEQTQITSFTFELGKLETLANIEFEYTSDADVLDTRLSTLGASFDIISYNTKKSGNLTQYDESKNSKIITRSIISNIISSVFDSAKASPNEGESLTTTQNAFNTLLNDIKSSIANISNLDKVITWVRELDYVGSLVKLNTDTKVDLSNITDVITSNLDKIAFNVKDNKFADIVYEGTSIIGDYLVSYENDTKFYNSVIITRPALKTMMTTILSTVKVTDEPLSDEDKIINELIDNLTNKVNEGSALINDTYSNYTDAFEDLNDIDYEINKVDETDGRLTLAETFTDLSFATLELSKMQEVDAKLDLFQSKIVCGISTTKKITVLILNRFESELKEELGAVTDASQTYTYLVKVIEYYDDNTRTSAEVYHDNSILTDTTLTTVYDNPFVRLYYFVNAEFQS